MSLFDGSREAYGQFTITGYNPLKKKFEGKAETIHKKVTLEHWERHLTTEQGLGIIPIRRDSTCVFGAIDVDDYALNHLEFIEKIRKLNFPLHPFRSKSGGAHLYCFTNEPVSAELMQDTLSYFASKLGYGRSEIFPKQKEIDPTKQMPGNWINVPYNKGTERPCLDDKAEPMSLETFCKYIEGKPIGVKELAKWTLFEEPEDEDDLLKGAILCIKNMIEDGGGQVPEGYGDDGLFQYALYAKKRWSVKWAEKVKLFNKTYMADSPMPERDLERIISQVDKKEYAYKCNDPKFEKYCDKANCVKTKYGPRLSSFIDWGSMHVINSEPPVYYWDMNGKTVKLESKDIVSPSLFKAAVFDQAGFYPPSMKDEDFAARVNDARSKAIEIKIERSLSKRSNLLEHLRNFCESRSASNMAKERDCILKHFVYKDTSKHEIRYHFRLESFVMYLQDHNVREFRHNEIIGIFKKDWQNDEGFQHKHCLAHDRFRISTGQPRVWSILFMDDTTYYDDKEEEIENGDR